MKKNCKKMFITTLTLLLCLQVVPNTTFSAIETNEENNISEDITVETEVVTEDTADATSQPIQANDAKAVAEVQSINQEFHKPEVDVQNKMVYANGTPIVIERVTGGTQISYIDADGNAALVDFGIAPEVKEKANLENYTIFGGSRNGEVESTSITHKSGDVDAIYGGGYAADGEVSTVTGDVTITLLENAQVNVVYGGGFARSVAEVEAQSSKAVVLGKATITASKNTEVHSIYGGGYALAKTAPATTTVRETSVSVLGNHSFVRIFGGGKASGKFQNQALSLITGNTYVSVTGNVQPVGEFDSDERSVFGGGYAISGYSKADVNGNTVVNVDLKSNDAGLSAIYGGGYAGHDQGKEEITTEPMYVSEVAEISETAVEETEKSVIADVHGSTQVNFNGGYAQIVSGGGYAIDLYRQASVMVATTVNVKNAIADYIYGGGVSTGPYVTNNKYEMRASTNVGTPGNTGVATTVNVTKDTQAFSIAGGGYADNTSNIIYGDTSVNVNTNSNELIKNIYGGGIISISYAEANIIGNTNVNVNSNTSQFKNVYGGGGIYEAIVIYGNLEETEDKLIITDEYAEAATKVTKSTNVTVDANIENVYGGAEVGSVEENTNVTINGGTYNAVYGSGKGTALVRQERSLYKEAEYRPYVFVISGYTAGNTNVTVNSGIITDIYGGGGTDISGKSGHEYTRDYVGYSIEPGAVDYEKDNLKLEITPTSGGNTNVTLNGGDIEYVFGGALYGVISQNTNIIIDGANIATVFGGGNISSTVEKNTNITMYSGKVAARKNNNERIISGIYGGGISAKVGYQIDETEQYFEDTFESMKPIPHDGFGHATIKVFGGSVATASTENYASFIVGSGVFDASLFGGPELGNINEYSATTYMEATPEVQITPQDYIDIVSPLNNGNVFIFVDDDVTFEGNAYKTFISDEIVQDTSGETVLTLELKFVKGDATFVIDQPMQTINTYRINGIGESIISMEKYQNYVNSTNNFRGKSNETGTGFDYNGEELNILRQEQRGTNAILTTDGMATLEQAGENNLAWIMPHWSIKGDVALPDDVTNEIKIIEKQELYIPIEANLTIPGISNLNNEGYIVTAKGNLGRGIENEGFVNSTTSNDKARIYRGDATNSLAITPINSTYALNVSATPLNASPSPTYQFLLSGEKIAYSNYTWTINGQVISETVSEVTPATDKVGTCIYTATTPFDVKFESVPTATGLVQDGSATSIAMVNVVDDILVDEDEDKDPTTPGDGIPDIYQTEVIYKVVKGTWNDTTNVDIKEVITFKVDGLPSNAPEALADLQKIPAGMLANVGYGSGSWDTTPPLTMTYTKDVFTYTYTFILNKYTVTYPGVPTTPGESLPEDSFEVDHGDKVIVDNNDGTPPTELTIEKDTVLDEPTRDGYTFEGYEFDETTNTLSATWSKNNSVPGTGDNTPIALSIAMIGISLIGVSIVTKKRKQKV